MKKKFLALVLTLAMVLSLVPATALAAGATQEGNNQGPVEVTGSDNDKNLTMKKTVMSNKDGTYTVRLESYATGEVKTTTTTESLDIVLLLDVSGSMNDSFTESNERYQAVYELSNGSVYYVRDKSNKYKKVTYCPTCAQWTNNCKNRLIGHRKGTAFTPKTSESDTTGTQFYEKVYSPAQSKMEALKRAVNGFIDNIAQNSPESKASIVKFAGEQSDAVGDSKYREGWYDYNYTQIVRDLTQVNPSGAEQLKQAVSNLEAAGATSSDYGLEKAKAVLDSESATQKKVIILFTDGEPNHDSGFDYEVATNAVNTAKTLKQDKTTIYTVGVFKNPSDDINQYMSSVSSNYPNATAQYIPGDWWENDTWRVIDGDSDSGTYYKTADSAGELINAFQTISSQVSSTNLNGRAVVVDKVPSNFKAPAKDSDVTLKVADYKADGTFDTETAAPSTIHASVNEDGTVSVTGFDFSKNWCGPEGDKPHGKKLIIEFTISRTNYGGTQPTNAGAYIKASSESPEKIIDLKNPEVPVTVWLPDQSNPYTDTKTYDGAGFDIKDKISKNIAGLVPVNGINNKFIDLTYEIKDSTGTPVGTYMISAGQTTGTWSDNSTEIKTSPNVGEYKYTITVTGQDTNEKQPNNKDSKECTATFTITKKEEVSYTVIFNANGGAWDDGNETVTQPYESSSSLVSRPTNDPKKSGSTFVDWAYKDAGGTFQSIGQNPFMGIRVSTLQQLSGVTGNSVTLYAVWKDNDTAPTGSLNYRINQYFIDETGKVANSISKPGRNTVDTAISTLISDLIPQDRSFPNYQYEKAKTTVNGEQYTDNKKLTQDNTVINLYYYLDSWKDGDTQNPAGNDEKTSGDGIPDYKQILIQYQVYQEGNGLVTPEFEVVTVKDNKELTAIHGSSVTKAGTGYTFVTWTGQNATVNETTVDKIVAESTKLNNKDCNPSGDTFEQGNSYTYTAIFLEDKIGGGENKDQPDGIPDAWQYKVTFKVANGKWDDKTTADVVAYVTNKKNGAPCAKGTEGSKATLDGVTIPVAGSQPDSGYTASGNWNTTPSATTVINKEDTVFTYTYDKKSGGSGGSGGSHKPTVTIPDDVPTGLNGKDHYAYVVGYPDGMVYPQKNITRAEVATIFFRLLKDETREANMTKSNSYNDMKDGAWYTCAVSTLSKMGIIKGYEDGSFKPDASISRAEFAAIAARFDPDGDKTPATFSDVSSHWAKDEISIAANHGWIKGYEDGSFKPDQKITRAETMTLVNRVLKRLPETKDDLHKDMKTWPDNQNESAWFYLAVQEATNSHYQKLKKDGTHETWESMRETRDWAALEK